tara:strand:- start:798 stop:959 length:162 start_codon:yes stop_codon:yes gene_type:complete
VIAPLIGEKSGDEIGIMLCIALSVVMEIEAIKKERYERNLEINIDIFSLVEII